MKETAIRERSLLCSTEEVRAILDGRKTQFRRPLKEQPKLVNPLCEDVWEFNGEVFGSTSDLACHLFHDYYGNHGTPYGSAYANGSADRLWVKERWQTGGNFDKYGACAIGAACVEAGYASPSAPIRYEADGAVVPFGDNDQEDFGAWGRVRLPIHMPRWASRILLEIADVRVERVQDISFEDCLAEGIVGTSAWSDVSGDDIAAASKLHPSTMADDESIDQSWQDHTRFAFRDLWNQTHEKRGFGWDVNPWVWVIGFKVLEVKR